MSCRPRRGRLALLAGLVLLVVGLAGCRVTTTVGVRVAANGSGAVSVDVTFDHQASTEVGGVVGQLKTSDLTQAGWKLEGPTAEKDGSTVVTVTHPFRTLSQIPSLLAEVATGARPGAPWALDVTRTGRADRQTMTATGSVDLTCGLNCFGDAALRKAFGSAVGLSDSMFSGPAGQAAARRTFVFHFTLSLPGRVTSSGSATRQGGTLAWTPVLGADTTLHGTSLIVTVPKSPPSTLPEDGAKETGAGVIVAVAVLVALALVLWRLVRRRRKRKATNADEDSSRGKHRMKTKA